MGNYLQDAWDDLRGKSKAGDNKNIKTLEPAERDRRQERLWADFESAIYGNQMDFDPKHYLEEYPEVAQLLGIDPNNMTGADNQKAVIYYLEHGKDMGHIGVPNLVKPLKDRIADDVAHRRTADEQYGSSMGGLRTGFLDTLAQNTDARLSSLADNTNQWQGQTNQLMDSVRPLATSAPMNINFGDFSMPFVSGSQAYSQNKLGQLSDKSLENQNFLSGERFNLGNLLNTETLGKMGDQAGLENKIAGTYTPNLANNMWMDWLQQITAGQDQMRYSIPGTTETAATKGSGLAGIGNIIDIGSKVAGLFG